MKIKKSRINECLSELKHKRIAVIGDLMLDEYLIGSVSRISTEAPVPVVDIKEESLRFGGAANVCLNLSTLGAIPVPFGVIGNDDAGNQFIEEAKRFHFSIDGVIVSDTRMTTVKTRVIGSNQQIVRIDKEVKTPILSSTEDQLLGQLKTHIQTLDAVIFQDYNKGVITQRVIKEGISICKAHNVPVFVDPKFSNFFEYTHVTLFKPNKAEASVALSEELSTMDDYKSACKALKEKLSASHILITLSAEGMLLLTDENQFVHIPTKAVEVADVSGAGDTVISTLVAMIVGGATLTEATILANEAAGIVVTEVGIIPITQEQLIDTGENV